MKTLVLFAVLALGAAAFAQEKSCPMCPVTPQPKAAAQHECQTCEAAQPCAHCDSLTAANPDARERAFWAEATKMQANDKVEHGELMACCAAKLTAGKADDCCADKAGMAPGTKAAVCADEDHKEAAGKHAAKHKEYASFKLYAGGQYHFFCCQDMALEARELMKSKGMTVGAPQKVVGKHEL